MSGLRLRRRPVPEGVERRWAMVRWRNGRLRFRHGLPPGALEWLCRAGLHFMTFDFVGDRYACRCRKQQLWFEHLWHGPRAERTPPVIDWNNLYRQTPPPPDRSDMADARRFAAHAATNRARADGPSSRDVLTRIDHTLDGLCPCGAEPRPGSPYCSYDCEPNITGEHTDQSEAGAHAYATPMRWRPDLVSETPDDGLTSLAGRARYGRFWREVFQRDGTDLLHLRLDDGHRFVGADVAPDPTYNTHADVWGRLERELADPRHAVAEQPDPNSFIESVLPRLLDDEAARLSVDVRVEPSHSLSGYAVPITPDPGSDEPWMRREDFDTVPREPCRSDFPIPPHLPQVDPEAVAEGIDHANAFFGEVGRQLPPVIEEIGRAMARYAAQIEAMRATVGAETSLTDQQERALAHVRNRNTGPQQQQRAPRRIDPRRRR